VKTNLAVSLSLPVHTSKEELSSPNTTYMHVLTHAHVSMHLFLGTLVKIQVLYLCLSLSELSCNFNHYAIIVVTKFCVGAPNICGSSVWSLLHVNLTPRILRWPLDLWKICKHTAFLNVELIVHHELFV
jgi:hypothetical protein